MWTLQSTPRRCSCCFVEEVKEPVHHRGFTPNMAALDAFSRGMWWVNYIVLLPTMLSCVGEEDPVAPLRHRHRPMCEAPICEALQLEVARNERCSTSSCSTSRRASSTRRRATASTTTPSA